MTMTDDGPLTKRDLIEQKIDKAFPTPSGVRVADSGALAYQNMSEVIEAAKMMSMSGAMIPPWLQGNPGACWAILIQASHWGFEPLAVARMAYEVTDKEGRKQVAYMAQLLHALIEARAPLRQRLRFSYAGEGETRTCTCSGHIIGEVEPLEYTSPPLSKITPKRSPLWSSDPDQQLAYYCSRSWARRYCPDVLMGVYDAEDDRLEPPRDVTPSMEALSARLAASRAIEDAPREGYRPNIVDETLNGPTEPQESRAESPSGVAEQPEEDKTRQRAPNEQPETPAKREKKAPKPPKDVKQYREHVRAWLASCETEQEVESQWRSEMGLRNRCNVTSDIKQEIRDEYVEPRIATLRRQVRGSATK